MFSTIVILANSFNFYLDFLKWAKSLRDEYSLNLLILTVPTGLNLISYSL